MYSYFDRYKDFLINGKHTVVPFISIPEKTSDKNHIYLKNVSRLDKISQEYYGSPLYDWFILLANPSFGGLEVNIPDRTVIRIPFPLTPSLQDYRSELEKYLTYYGR